MFTKIQNWIISAFGEDKVKWIKGILAYFLIIVVSNFVFPFTHYINNIGWQPVWVNYILIVTNAGVMVLIGFIIFFLGKPIIPNTMPETGVPEKTVVESEPEPIAEPEVAPEPPV